MGTKRTIILDPGHGGTANAGGSSWNNAKSPSGVLEKTMTLQMAKLVRSYLKNNAEDVRVFLTRKSDRNLGLKDRANFAKEKKADLFLSIHFNGFNSSQRGVETLIRPESDGNVNYQEDKVFAKKIQRQVYAAIKSRDSRTRNRGVKDLKLGVLKDSYLGNSADNHPCRACLVEIEFIDVPDVDKLLNTNENAKTVRQEIAKALGKALIAQLS